MSKYLPGLMFVIFGITAYGLTLTDPAPTGAYPSSKATTIANNRLIETAVEDVETGVAANAALIQVIRFNAADATTVSNSTPRKFGDVAIGTNDGSVYVSVGISTGSWRKVTVTNAE